MTGHQRQTEIVTQGMSKTNSRHDSHDGEKLLLEGFSFWEVVTVLLLQYWQSFHERKHFSHGDWMNQPGYSSVNLLVNKREIAVWTQSLWTTTLATERACPITFSVISRLGFFLFKKFFTQTKLQYWNCEAISEDSVWLSVSDKSVSAGSCRMIWESAFLRATTLLDLWRRFSFLEFKKIRILHEICLWPIDIIHPALIGTHFCQSSIRHEWAFRFDGLLQNGKEMETISSSNVEWDCERLSQLAVPNWTCRHEIRAGRKTKSRDSSSMQVTKLRHCEP